MRQATVPGWLAALTVAALGTGCSESSSVPSGTVGEVGFGVFSYSCVGDGDAACNEGAAVDAARTGADLGVGGQLPVAVAVGGRFDLLYWGSTAASAGGLPRPVEIVPASPHKVRTVGGFTFLEAGTMAFLVRSPQGVVSDFIHLTAAPPVAYELWWNGAQVSSFTIEQPGLDSTVAVVPVDRDDIALAGALGYSWTSSDSSVLRVAAVGTMDVPEPDAEVADDEVRVVAVAAGEALLQLDAGGTPATMNVTVLPEVIP